MTRIKYNPDEGYIPHGKLIQFNCGMGQTLSLLATYPRGPPTRAASHPHVQAVDGPEVRREAQRRRRPLRRSSRPCGCSLGRREEPNPGTRPHPAGIADEARPRRDDDARLQRHGTTTLFAALNILDSTVI